MNSVNHSLKIAQNWIDHANDPSKDLSHRDYARKAAIKNLNDAVKKIDALKADIRKDIIT